MTRGPLSVYEWLLVKLWAFHDSTVPKPSGPPGRPVSERPDTTRKRDALRTREAILAASIQEFGTYGFAGARIERIVAQAQCNIRLAYHHFGDKEGLYLAAVERAYSDLRTAERDIALDPAQPYLFLETLLRFTIRYFDEHPHLEGLIRNENISGAAALRKLSGIARDAAYLTERLATAIDAGEAAGLFRPGLDPTQLYVTITALSRFHIANSQSLSIVLDADIGSRRWRLAWEAHSVALLRAYVLRTADAPERLP